MSAPDYLFQSEEKAHDCECCTRKSKEEHRYIHNKVKKRGPDQIEQQRSCSIGHSWQRHNVEPLRGRQARRFFLAMLNGLTIALLKDTKRQHCFCPQPESSAAWWSDGLAAAKSHV
jgi:hypothetical protein